MSYRKKRTTRKYKSVWDIFCDVAETLRPPERLTVSQAAEKYRYVNQPGAYVGPWLNSTVPYMVEPMDTFASRRYTGMIFVGPAQSAKPLALDTPIPTPDGWTTMGDIQVGDKVFDENGDVVVVNLVTPVKQRGDCYRITFDDGTSLVCDGEHRWAVNDCWGADPYTLVVKSTKDMLDRYQIRTKTGHRFRYSIPVAGALKLPEADLPIDPYFLGLWLGDGSRTDGALCLGEKDCDEIVWNIEARGMRVSGITHANSRGTAKRVVVHDSLGSTMRANLKSLGLLGNKSIPSIYLRASIEQRRDLLRGLIDTDGTVGVKGRIQFSQTLRPLFDQVVELVRSLGYKPMIDEYVPNFTYNGERRKGDISYRLSFSIPGDSTNCTALNRHVDRHEKSLEMKTTRPTHSGRRFIRSIAPVDSVPVRCIGVDSLNHLFLVGEQMVPTHNTDSLVLNTVAYSVKVDPMDMMIVCPTMTAARDFSIRRIDRLHRHSRAIGEMMLPGADSDNKFDKHYSTGMLLSLSWPTPTELAGKPIGRIVMTDRDRMPDDVDGDGEPFDLASKRTTTFGTYAMTVAESSPSRPVEDLKWVARTPHEAPPCAGILGLYNRGDRRRWYWPCPSCNRYFEGMFTHLEIDENARGTNLEKATSVRMKCPHCAYKIHPDERGAMNEWGLWLKDGQGIDEKGRVFGPEPRTLIASFWLRGVAAAFVTWPRLMALYLDALDEFNRTGSEEGLKKFYNNDLGEPYYSKNAMDGVRLPEVVKSRAESIGERVVPEDVRFLVATIDVQKNMWVVQVFGILPGSPFDTVVIDRFEIVKSDREDADGERLWVKPHAYLEDWDKITEQVLLKEYPLGDGSGRMMGIKMVGCDSGGRDGVTTMAYAYYRKLREENMHRRFILLKGETLPNQPRSRINYPDSSRRDSKAGARGDIPVLMLNSNLLKDDLNGRLDCIEPGKGMYRTPDWLSDKFYSELCSEIRTIKGWENPAHTRNEAWDLSYYCLGVCVSELIRAETIDWNNPPKWAAPWDRNDMIREPAAEPKFAKPNEASYDFSSFGKALA